MRWRDVTARPTERQLREIAAALALVAAAVAGWRALSGAPAEFACAALLGLAAIGLGIWQPRWLTPVFQAGMLVTFPLAWTVSLVVLAIVFYSLMTPLALMFRLLGRDALGCRRRAEQRSYWQVKPEAQNLERYLRQF